MRFQLPQFIETEVKIVGPFTLKQFLWLAGGAAILTLVYMTTGGAVFFILAIPVGGIFLGLGRALGETMAVTFVIGNTHRMSVSLFEPGNSIASTLANEFNEAVGDMHTSALIALGLVLFMITFIVLALAKLLLLGLESRDSAKS